MHLPIIIKTIGWYRYSQTNPSANMKLAQLLHTYIRDQRTKSIVQALQHNTSTADTPPRLFLRGLIGSAKAFVSSGVYRHSPQNHVFILENKETAAYFQNDLKNILSKKDVLFFPDSFKKPGKFTDVNKSNVLLRTETVGRLIRKAGYGELLVTYPEALFEKIVNTKTLQENIIQMKKGESLDVPFITEMMVEYGFEHQDFVYEPGQFSIRGGIVDIYSFGNELPYRVELFGDEVESIRVFDPLTQLSERTLSQVNIVPNIHTQFSSTEKTSLFKILPENTTIWIQDTAGLLAITEKSYEKTIETIAYLEQQDLLTEHDIFGSEDGSGEELLHNFLTHEQLFADLSELPIVEFGRKSHFSTQKNATNKVLTINYACQAQPSFNKNFHLLIEDFKQKTEDGFLNTLFAGNDRQIKRFKSIFTDMGEKVEYTPISLSIHEGFIDEKLGLALYTDHQIFERFYKYKIKQGFSKDKAITIRLLRELQPSNYVVHIDHGVGQYSGLEKITVNGQVQEVMRILYASNDKLYVNINSLHKVSKYVGKDGRKPKVNKLGSDAWAAVKRKTKKKIKDIAADLIKLYAQRKTTKGFTFSPDTYLQTELEASFIYEDTPDQLTTTLDVKKDMENFAPMDRLVCGDVGFGKTEIAIRAAAKAVADEKQVAILVPTTILALQHFKTFSERMKEFPATIDYLNRFKTAKQKRITLEKLAEGKIDIVIGTHALLGKQVKFKDLGLLVVDEEQKFGVAAKEKLRNIKINVDTLTLTATPIPRTLQFSLMNARDLSIMRTPPPNRQPVETEVIRFEEEKIRDAINFEVYRGGQVFFIHNRVKDLVEITTLIKKLCPDFDVGIAHGQLDNKTLEERLMKFIDGKYDVLVSTNIVESGLDIPNANTIIINNAHHFGLSDLHQMRGRVGRSNKKAFCYLIAPALYGLPDDSRKRLQAIEYFSDLGSGFQIAMKDLDIRGAGNLLGGEQSGFIADIGYHTFHKILDETIQELKENEFKDVFEDEVVKQQTYVRDCQMDSDLEILIPTSYINNTNERLKIYTAINEVTDEMALKKFRDDLIDRFGPLPQPVKELISAIRLRWIAKKLGFERILLKSNKLRCYFVGNPQSSYYQTPLFARILQYAQHSRGKAHFKQSKKYLMVIFDGVTSMNQARKNLLEIETFAFQKKS